MAKQSVIVVGNGWGVIEIDGEPHLFKPENVQVDNREFAHVVSKFADVPEVAGVIEIAYQVAKWKMARKSKEEKLLSLAREVVRIADLLEKTGVGDLGHLGEMAREALEVWNADL